MRAVLFLLSLSAVASGRRRMFSPFLFLSFDNVSICNRQSAMSPSVPILLIRGKEVGNTGAPPFGLDSDWIVLT